MPMSVAIAATPEASGISADSVVEAKVVPIGSLLVDYNGSSPYAALRRSDDGLAVAAKRKD